MKQIPSQQEIERFLAVKPNNKDTGYGDGEGSGEGTGIGFGYGYGESAEKSFGSGDGEGAGFGNGEGYGKGYGKGCDFGESYGHGGGNSINNGKGFDNGEGYGKGNGFGEGKAISSYNGYRVYIIDRLHTLIYQIRGNYAKGAIVNSDLTLTPCYIARVDDYFAHGETLRDAVQDAREKALNHTPIKIRIQQFIQKYPDPDKPVPFAELFEWHHILTGSCRFGREKFVEQHQLDTNAEYTPRFFINLTKNDFGGEIIRKLTKAYNL